MPTGWIFRPGADIRLTLSFCDINFIRFWKEDMMPKKMEEKLKREAHKKGLRGEALRAYVYGTMRKSGWKPNREKKRKK